VSDVATLGLAIDSSQVTTATAALNRMAAAAQPAAKAANNLQTAAAAASNTLATHTQATNSAANAHAGMSTQAMAAMHSLRSMFEQMALGVPPTQILAAQMNHLTYAASGPGGLKAAFAGALGSLKSFISPTALVVGGLAAIAGASYLAYTNIKQTELEFDALAQRSDSTVQALHGLQSAASFKGIDQGDFLKDMTKFADLTYQAQHNAGSLAELFRANGVAVGTVNQNLLRAADLIANAKDNAQKYQIIQQLGLPATEQWVRFLSQGAAGIQEAINNAVKFGGTADEALIARAKRFDEAWATTWTNFQTRGKSAFVELMDLGSRLGDSVTRGLMKIPGLNVPRNMLSAGLAGVTSIDSTRLTANSDVSGFYRGTGAPQAAPGGPLRLTVNPRRTISNVDLKNELSLEQQRISILGQSASVSDLVKQKQNEINLARLNGVTVTKAEEENLKRLAQEDALGVTAIRQQTDALNVQAESFGMTAGRAAAYAAVQTKINEAIRVGKPLTADQIAQLQAQANALANATDRMNYMNESASTLADSTRTFRDDLQNGASGWKAFGDAGMSALTSIENKLIDIGSKKLVEAAFGGLDIGGMFGFGSAPLNLGNAGGTAGLLPAIHHGGYGPGDPISLRRVVDSSIFVGAPRYHSGIGPGERPAIVRDDESVLTPGQMKQLAPVGSGGNGAVTVNVMNAPAGTSATATVSRGAKGMRIDVQLRQTQDDNNAGLIASGQSATNSALERRYGLTPKI
jgi:hypothetical protein